MLLVVGDVGGYLVGPEGGLEFRGACGFQSFLVIFGVGHLFPFFEQARVGATNHVAQIVLHVEEFFVLVAVGNGLGEHLVNAIQVPQQNSFHALQSILLYVAAKGAEIFKHFAHDALGFDIHVDPRVFFGKGVEGVVNEIAKRLGIFHLLNFFHALVEFHALRLELVEASVTRLVLLNAEDCIRVFHNAFAQSNDIERIFGAFAVQFRKRVYQVQRKRLVHGKVVLQVHVNAELAVAGRNRCHKFNDILLDEALEKLKSAVLQFLFACDTFVAILEQVAHGGATVRGATENVQKHSVTHLETRCERFWGRCNEALESAFVKRDVAVFGRFLFLEFFACLLGFGFQFQVLDDMLGSLRYHVADVVETFTAGAACNLVEVAGGQDCRLVAAVLAELREKHRSNGNIHADAQCVRAANDFKQALLRKFFAENAVLGQKSCVVQANALLEPALDFGAVGAAEADFLDGVVNRLFFFFSAKVQTHEILGVGRRGRLRKMHHVNGRLAARHKLLHRIRNLGFGIAEIERNWAL